ncbi:uncharacterized protein SPPG_08177 [Spizellomyces punctatus DAOM BR117]|uniref:NTF2 domain-containing protein n=1 Tax=Spizellomyces punctatus (strain DAOM BR117) TaxID=645134 RepID=A0A0L0H7C4_SPIPD|nr:uncharacterized protein SPPG_08177 [Spizellomyces punctatus DAOM BR117]KNC96593.1 hypothetical protein SPPG_08177 [Spizellomyces punctatus DAOM BR117]|eukprot:XP_016604633.1 hypothetical protein SPPG_08177 [Spizellomyces punctatus DAOM BR117]
MSFQGGRRGQSYGSDRGPRGGYGDLGGGGGYDRRGRGRGRGYGGRGTYQGTVEDKDGDIMMGDSAEQDQRRSRQSLPYNRPRPSSSASHSFNGDVAQVQVSNVPPETGAPGLMAWLCRRAGGPVTIVHTEVQRNSIVFTTQNALQAQTLAKLSGVNFLQHKLIITQGGGGSMQSHPSRGVPGDTSGRTNIIDAFRMLIRSRYRPENKFLDLENMVSDPIMQNAGVRGFEAESKMGGVICKMIGELCPDVSTISFASNRLTTLQHVSNLPKHVPNVTALSFQDNQLRSFRDLEPLKGADLPHLRELLLIGNPVRDKEVAKPGGEIVYRSDVKKLFPSIELLDMEPVIGDITFAVDAMSVELPLSVKPGFMDSPATAATATDFVQKFLRSFDGNRETLFDVYHDQACFSLMVDNRSRGTSNKQHYFDTWRNFNRNLDKVKDAGQRINTVHRGATDIIGIFKRLPKTQHPIDQPEDHRKLLIEAYQTGGGAGAMLFVMVHGEFKEADIRTYRSFDRTFIIVPAVPGSRSAMAGLPYSVVNDQLTVRAWASNRAWVQPTDKATSGEIAQTPAVNGSVPAPQLPDIATLRALQLQHGLDDARQNLVIEFAKATGLNYKFSFQCLSETGWSMPNAMDAFQRVKHNIPPEAYRLV